METTLLTNFNVPIPLRSRFDAICEAIGRSRTSVLVELMSDYIVHQSQHLAARNHQFKKIDELLGENTVLMGDRSFSRSKPRPSRYSVQTRSNQDLELPGPMFSDGQEDW
jgi:hypothetical protein